MTQFLPEQVKGFYGSSVLDPSAIKSRTEEMEIWKKDANRGLR